MITIENEDIRKVFEHLNNRLSSIEQHVLNIVFPLQAIKEMDSKMQRHLNTPFTIDDRSFQSNVGRFILELEKSLEKIQDASQTAAEIKYIGKKLNEIENKLENIKEEGIKKKIHLNLTCDGYEMRKKVNPYDKAIEEKEIDPDISVEKLLDTLLPRENAIIIYRLGLLGEKKRTLKEIGKIFNISSVRARQIYMKAIIKLRHHSRKALVSNISHLGLRKEIIGD